MQKVQRKVVGCQDQVLLELPLTVWGCIATRVGGVGTPRWDVPPSGRFNGNGLPFWGCELNAVGGELAVVNHSVVDKATLV